MTVMGDAAMEGLSDRGSIPLSSIVSGKLEVMILKTLLHSNSGRVFCYYDSIWRKKNEETYA